MADYFLYFEKTVINLNGLKSVSPMLLQTLLSGKAQKIYASPSVGQRISHTRVSDPEKL